MDIRGIEITNQLRSAIRAKLLELGVRYDDELPDYILVMVVNKKSRQQMNEDLQLFLEDSTETFVDWLHDQVLKKLQKVTIAKKKGNKEAAPLLPIKKEEGSKKVKEENESETKPQPEELTKQERDREFEELVGDLAMLNEDDSKSSFKEMESDETSSKEKGVKAATFENSVLDSEKKTTPEKKEVSLSTINTVEFSSTETNAVSPKQSRTDNKLPKNSESSSQSIKRKSNTDESFNEKSSSNKRTKISYNNESENDEKLKSTINKPRITSVVSVKTRLGAISPTKKLQSQVKTVTDKSVTNKSFFDDRRNEVNSQRSGLDQSKNEEKRKHKNEDLRNEIKRDKSVSSSKNDRSNKIGDLREKVRLSSKPGTIKSRLGISTKTQTQSKLSLKPSSSTKVSKPKVSNVKSRLGVKVKPQSRGLLSEATRLSQFIKDSNNFEDEDDDAESLLNTTLKSHIIAVQNSKAHKSIEKSLQVSKKQKRLIKDNKAETLEESITEDNEEDDYQGKIPSKVIVTPRPLKPLQPSQKRATQSLLLRAVAEANQSVVMQKKIDPCLKEPKPRKKFSKIKITRDPKEGKVLAINLKPKKKITVDKIQIELANRSLINPPKPHFTEDVTEEDLDVMKSLFKRTDDKQKFLVTLNGYNNNVLKEQNSDDEYHLEMEANEEEYFDDNQYEIYIENDQIIDDHDKEIENENEHVIDQPVEQDDDEDYTLDQLCEESEYFRIKYNNSQKMKSNIENLKKEENSTMKRKKHSPIVYSRSRSNSPTNKPTVASTVSPVLYVEKRPVISSVITTVADKSNEKCRYWPNCTLGIKCAYYHPDVPCSSFPACKFGDKCAYKHPKCKFGSACTKLGCIFSHPPVQCKYHPYCMKPGCPFSHPKTSSNPLSPLSPLTPDISSVRAKFTWKKKE